MEKRSDGERPFHCKWRGLPCFFFRGRGTSKYIRRIFCGKKNSKTAGDVSSLLIFLGIYAIINSVLKIRV